MALAHIVLDQNSRACLWLCFALGDSDGSTFTGTRWLAARYLPRQVESVPFPNAARGLVLGHNKDVVEDFVEQHGAPFTPWAADLSKVTLRLVEMKETASPCSKPEGRPRKKRRHRSTNPEPSDDDMPDPGGQDNDQNGATAAAIKAVGKLEEAQRIRDTDSAMKQTQHNIDMAKQLAQSQTDVAAMTLLNQQFVDKETEAALRRKWDDDRQPQDNIQAALLSSLKEKMLETEMRETLKMDFKDKKKNMKKQIEIFQQKATDATNARLQDLQQAVSTTNQSNAQPPQQQPYQQPYEQWQPQQQQLSYQQWQQQQQQQLSYQQWALGQQQQHWLPQQSYYQQQPQQQQRRQQQLMDPQQQQTPQQQLMAPQQQQLQQQQQQQLMAPQQQQPQQQQLMAPQQQQPQQQQLMAPQQQPQQQQQTQPQQHAHSQQQQTYQQAPYLQQPPQQQQVMASQQQFTYQQVPYHQQHPHQTAPSQHLANQASNMGNIDAEWVLN